jgi:hypothetical protein
MFAKHVRRGLPKLVGFQSTQPIDQILDVSLVVRFPPATDVRGRSEAQQQCQERGKWGEPWNQ